MPRFTLIGPGEMIYGDLRSSGTTSPAQVTSYFEAEKGFITMMVKLATTAASERLYGAVKVVADDAAAGSGYEGRVARQLVAGEGSNDGFVGVLPQTITEIAGTIGLQARRELQCYGYNPDSQADGGVTANDTLYPKASTDGWETAVRTVETTATATVTVVRACAVALADDATDSPYRVPVFLFGL